ncbi:tRNA 1-methyladenosine methyltransferase subunit [Starmerella bacillaris]|uniref:tRNA (adenine(58)-N(1))-methyltransferase catalytic subunit TRM61 n=1 Tax=Starmerella bacillaris TaxID=1247836 RepID=A0AAV5RLQ8_STABA|nr:tRNA 1-methyladenosine methyltransferase subunit [Starmerella bacillaris]
MFLNSKRIIEEGDLVLIWISRTVIRPVYLKKDEALQTKFGHFLHNDMIGRPFGSQISATQGRGFVHVLAPTPELWALSLPHRTQIVYSPDSSYIIHRLQIRPDSKVVEAGTGSGALTHALARAVGTDGTIFTYEYHEDRHMQAVKEFKDHELSDIITCTHRNVCEDGFQIEKPTLATAVFLDLPAPWTAIPKLFEGEILNRKEAVHICCFSPCIEQVSKTVKVLEEHGFQSIEMVENQAKRWEGHESMVRSVDEALDVLRDVRKRRNMGIERRKRKRLVSEVEAEQSEEDKKLLRGDYDNPVVYNPWGKGERVKEGDDGYKWAPVSTIEPEIKNHTSYLTFALLPPLQD